MLSRVDWLGCFIAYLISSIEEKGKKFIYYISNLGSVSSLGWKRKLLFDSD